MDWLAIDEAEIHCQEGAISFIDLHGVKVQVSVGPHEPHPSN